MSDVHQMYEVLMSALQRTASPADVIRATDETLPHLRWHGKRGAFGDFDVAVMRMWLIGAEVDATAEIDQHAIKITFADVAAGHRMAHVLELP
ncbi:hypothetical protein GCM10010371_67350 [Streptomyces subrutilus]|uniref:Uncharacterized protein n=1 Tax=Streptomyces subrutilus TaxID=36818 RepID=A0A918RGM0_9ACTN|nr:hypothetical protein [Streptomyces subrutilus]GGZ98146.1 hypothetical protein GCM10010371_67350 [Streptomyces subrutilus]